ncbi:uncharacterized protein LOC8075794 isoform X1 [Sorghum bicolor]|uniref:uncharacterized protein LOC8075794 isoform X1 n=1 Tax=Sorghum bicolor TaxID=4558 RepID=UPI000B425451|nr:uncharacterized protein LOC8075794 isoform X1 [Sorghum bicolor]|eukprot:XP_021316945.1 uncharacterized protein LOC8075794 isoform X1 [Sorghum bicolor]
MAAAGGESMMTREQLLHLFSRFSFLISLPEVKQRIADAVRDKQEAVAVTTEIQEEILHEMGVVYNDLMQMRNKNQIENDDAFTIDPSFGIGCLGKVNVVYENDKDLMIKFYQFVAKEEMAIDEAELEPRELAAKLHAQQIIQEQQLNMLVEMRKYSPESQSVILGTLHRELEEANFDINTSILSPEQIQEIVQK